MTHVSIPSDYGPDEPRLHLVQAEDGDICVSVHPGERHPCVDAFIACNSGTQDANVGRILGLLMAYANGDEKRAADMASSLARDLGAKEVGSWMRDMTPWPAAAMESEYSAWNDIEVPIVINKADIEVPIEVELLKGREPSERGSERDWLVFKTAEETRKAIEEHKMVGYMSKDLDSQLQELVRSGNFKVASIEKSHYLDSDGIELHIKGTLNETF